MTSEKNNGKEKDFFYFVDNVKYTTEERTITGAQIRAKIPGLDPQYQLFLEGHANDPDQLVSETTSIDLSKDKGPKRFFTVPPATFG